MPDTTDQNDEQNVPRRRPSSIRGQPETSTEDRTEHRVADREIMKTAFLTALRNENYFDRKKAKRELLSTEKYNLCLTKLKEALDNPRTKPSAAYRLKNKYALLTVDNVDYLVKRQSDLDQLDTVSYVAHEGNIFDAVEAVHESTGHAGNRIMQSKSKLRYWNITEQVLALYKSLCRACAAKEKGVAKKGIVVKPILSKSLNSRAQVDLINFQQNPDGDYQYILTYIDHLTKFTQLKAVRSREAKVVAPAIIECMATLGPPCILHTDNGKEFRCELVWEEIRRLWPEVRFVSGTPRHSQSQGCVEKANDVVQEILVPWQVANKTKEWVRALPLVQFAKNSRLNIGIGISSIQAVTGVAPMEGLRSLGLPDSVTDGLRTVNELEELQKQQDRMQEDCYNPSEDTASEHDNRNDNSEMDAIIEGDLSPAANLNSPTDILGQVLSPFGRLDDESMSRMIDIFLQQFPQVHGLESTFLGQHLAYTKCDDAPFVHILHGGREEHWLTVSNINCSPGVVNVYDSYDQQVPTHVVHQICAIYTPEQPTILLRSIPCQKQTNGYDCGVFAIANCLALLRGDDPAHLSIDEASMRIELAGFLTAGAFGTFTPAAHPVARTKANLSQYALHCSCKQCWFPPRLQNEPLQLRWLYDTIVCTKCLLHFHKKCLGKSAVIDQQSFVCQQCAAAEPVERDDETEDFSTGNCCSCCNLAFIKCVICSRYVHHTEPCAYMSRDDGDPNFRLPEGFDIRDPIATCYECFYRIAISPNNHVAYDLKEDEHQCKHCKKLCFTFCNFCMSPLHHDDKCSNNIDTSKLPTTDIGVVKACYACYCDKNVVIIREEMKRIFCNADNVETGNSSPRTCNEGKRSAASGHRSASEKTTNASHIYTKPAENGNVSDLHSNVSEIHSNKECMNDVTKKPYQIKKGKPVTFREKPSLSCRKGSTSISSNVRKCQHNRNCQLPVENDNVCELHARQRTISSVRNKVRAQQIKQAHTMIRRSRKSFPALAVGTHVALKVSHLDRAKNGERNLLGIITRIDNNGMYEIGCRHGTLNRMQCRTQLKMTRIRDIELDNVPKKQLALRTAYQLQNVTGKQKLVKCNCTRGCKNNQCGCVRNKLRCSSNCHDCKSCANKP